MTKIPDPINTVAALVDAAQRNELPRHHMGCSLLGHPCQRWLWLSFRWSVVEQFSGRILRLFRRGQMEEATVIADLQAAGLVITDTGAQQSRVNFGGHVSGSIDGIIQSGVPEAPEKPHILEIKTHSKKSFDELDKIGVEKSKPQHYTQIQVYMLGKGIDRALYYAVCKDDDRIYTERVKLDKIFAEKSVSKGQRIALSDRIPPPISTDSTWYQCRFCAAHDFCHGSKIARQVNCRTCAHSTAKIDNSWRCERHGADGIPVEYQRTGCRDHVIHPDLVPWQLDQNHSTETTACYVVSNDRHFRNGTDGLSSHEIIASVK